MHKICVFIPKLEIGGAEKQSLLLADVLKNHYEVYVIVYNGNSVEDKYLQFIREMGIQVVLLKGFSVLRIIRFFLFLHREKIDVIFSYLAKCNFIGAIIGRMSHVKYIIGGIRNSFLEPRKLQVQRLLHNRFFDFTISNNFCSVDYLVKKGYRKDKIIVIPNGINFSNQPIKRSNSNEIRILSLGRFVQQKDYYTALKSIHHLVNYLLPKNYAVKYYIVGYGKLQDQILEWMNKLNLTSCTQLVIKPENLEKYLENCDIFLSTSMFEGVSNGIMEAMSFSLPVVATNVGDNDRLIIHGKNGYMVNGSDPKKIASYLLQLVEDYHLRSEFGLQGYNHLSVNYSVERFKTAYLEVLSSLLKS